MSIPIDFPNDISLTLVGQILENMKLHIIRHAKTNQESPSGKDFDRQLLPRGKRQCATLLKFIQGKTWDVPTILCSGAKRTRETFAGIEHGFTTKRLRYDDQWYLCSHKTWLETIWKEERSEDLILIGHNFGISDLVEYLTEKDLVLGTSEYICIEFDGASWKEVSRGNGTIVERFRPDDR